ncbi:uncharacterized protein LOC110096282 isoform X2 [Dendrobium catenatum]|uniref:Translocation and assembly module TamB C-terminal domain-containing protein n=1 Tax=Dendrobium catenatum TaxID=906689 RepID=A0A2I0XAQ4_9ASPA|nr:uncharacterized protein LOC110096282 isoform X2 [Dendrobium catenatum]PKU85008.1 hypothetical protein MA16_Dca017177 [Dendrobium catenatum]
MHMETKSLCCSYLLYDYRMMVLTLKMSTDHLCSSLLGAPSVSITRRNSGKPTFLRRNKNVQAPFIFLFLGQHKQCCKYPSLSLVNGKSVDFPLRNTCNRSHFRVSCTKEQFPRNSVLVKPFVPLFKDALLLVRFSMFVAVMFAVGIFLWYAQKRAKRFVESQLLPSVCSILSEYIQREIDFGKVQSVSPLGFTLEACSIGPHQEEFSCGEVSTMKIRVRPFASLRRGKIVLNAFLSQPNILVSQKEDFSWLGIPSSSFSGLRRHRSLEEGIDYRTKTRRLAREESVARWSKERVKAAREAAEQGYIVPQGRSDYLMNDESKDDSLHSGFPPQFSSFNCMDENMFCKDNHSRSIWAEYGLKHADMEKSFGARSGHGQIFWSKIMPEFMRHRLKGIFRTGVSPASGIAAKKRNLQRSAAAARAYFHGPSNGKTDEPCTNQRVDSSYEGCKDNSAKAIQLSVLDKHSSEDHSRYLSTNNEEISPPYNVSASSMGMGRLEKPTNIILHRDENVKIDDPKHGNLGFRELDDHKSISRPFALVNDKLLSSENFISGTGAGKSSHETVKKVKSSFLGPHSGYFQLNKNNRNQLFNFDNLLDPVLENAKNSSEDARCLDNGGFHHGSFNLLHHLIPGWLVDLTFNLFRFRLPENPPLFDWLIVQAQEFKSYFSIKAADIAAELSEEIEQIHAKGVEKVLPITLDSVYFNGGTLMVLGYGDREPREMLNANGYAKFQNQYSRVHVQLSGDCVGWRTDNTSYNGGQLTTLVYVDTTEQKWHANLKISSLFAPLFERIFDIPIIWYQGRATGEVHLCMSTGDTFPNIHGQLEVTGLSFQIYDAPSIFSQVTATLCFRGQRVFLHNAVGYFGDAPIEASGDFGINPDNGEFHLMCQVPNVEVNALMKTLKMRPLMFPLAGTITAIFNCQGPLDAPLFVGSGNISRKAYYSLSTYQPSAASEAVTKNKDAGAVAAFDHIPFSHVSANFTFNLDNSVVDLYGIRATLLDGGEIRGAGTAWICPEGEVDDTAMDVNFSGKFLFDKVLQRYLAEGVQMIPFKIGEVNGETKLSGPILKPRFDIKWAAPEAEDSFTDARGEIIISHEFITIISSAVAFDLNTKIQTLYVDKSLQLEENLEYRQTMATFIIEAIELDLRMRGFELASFVSTPFEAPRPLHLRATGRFKLQGKVVRPNRSIDGKEPGSCGMPYLHMVDSDKPRLSGEVSLSGIKINQLMLAPQLAGSLSISHDAIKLDAMGRADENLSIEVIGPISHRTDETPYNNKSLSISLQKGQLKANICYQPQQSANLEVKNLPLDELELASLRGSIQRAEIQLNFQKRRGHGILSVLHPKFSGLLGEALDVAARWSGDVITVEKTILEQASSRYELQGEYVLPGTRDRYSNENKGVALLKRAMAGHFGSVISSMGRWRMRLEVPGAEVSEMLPLARLLSRSTDPAVQSRSKEFFMHCLQSDGFHAEGLRDLLEEIQNHYKWSEDNILEDVTLPGLAEFRGHWRGSLDASGGGNGDTMADFDFSGEDWEWGTYKSQRIIASGAYSNNNGLRLEKLFIQKENATLHADGTLLGPVSNLHFAVLNFPVSLVPTLVQIIESSTADAVHPLRQVLLPIKGILHMEGDLRGNLAKPECDVQIRLLDGAIGGIDLGRAEIVASATENSRFLFNAHFEPVIQSGHVHIQGSIPVTYSQDDSADAIDNEGDVSVGSLRNPIWLKENERGSSDETSEKKVSREKHEEGWNIQLAVAESLKDLNWNLLDAGEVRINANIKDGGMMLLTALSPYANWLHGFADIDLQVTGSVEQPIVDGSASFHRATVSSPALWKPLTNFGGTVHVISNRICISSVEGRVSRKGKLSLKGNLPLKPTQSFVTDKIELKCDFLEVRMKNFFSGQVDSQMQIMGSILQPNISGFFKLSHGEAYLPHDTGNGEVTNSVVSKRTTFPAAGFSRATASGHISRFFGSLSGSLHSIWPEPGGKHSNVEEKLEVENANPGIDARLTDLKLVLGPELRIVYPLILNFAVSGELELNGIARPMYVKPKGILMFENGDVNLVATQVRLKRDHLNVAKFEPDLGLDPILDLILVGSEWQFRIQGRASSWQDNLIVTSTRSVDQDVLTPSEAARVFESQLAESLLEGDGQLAFKKLATATLETLMPRIEGKGEFGQARWRLVYAPQIPSLLSVDPTIDPLKSLASNISFGTEVEIQLGKRLLASVVRQMKDSEMAMQWTLSYQLTDRLRLLFQSVPSNRLLFEYSAISQK